MRNATTVWVIAGKSRAGKPRAIGKVLDQRFYTSAEQAQEAFEKHIDSWLPGDRDKIRDAFMVAEAVIGFPD